MKHGPHKIEGNHKISKATWNGVVLAESDQCLVVEGNLYFPPDSIKREHFVESDKATKCFWKGEASYYSIKVGAELNENAAWFYRAPMQKAKEIKDYVAFWHGVEVSEAN